METEIRIIMLFFVGSFIAFGFPYKLRYHLKLRNGSYATQWRDSDTTLNSESVVCEGAPRCCPVEGKAKKNRTIRAVNMIEL